MAKGSQPHAFILICWESGTPLGNIEKIKAIPQVQEVHAVYGMYDEIARVKADSMQEFNAVNSKIRSLPNIRSTITMFIE